MRPKRWVLLPGLDGSGLLFRRFLRFVDDSDVVVIDYPNDPEWHIDDYVHHVIQRLPDADCLLVAESFSVPIALRVATRVASINGVVLVAGFAGCPNPLLKFVPMSLVAFARRLDTANGILRMFCVGRDAPRDIVDELRRVVSTIPTAVLRSRLSLLRSLEQGNPFQGVEVPLLLIRARDDRLVRDPLAVARGHPMASAEVIEGPHFLLQTRAAECWQAIQAWLSERDRAARTPMP